MKKRKTAKNIYRVLRSVLFSAVGLVVALYLVLYIALSLPGVQNRLRAVGEEQLGLLLGSKVKVGTLSVNPFNEVVVKDVAVYTPQAEGGEKCISIGSLGAGVSLWQLIFHQQIVITYAELLDFDGRVWQSAEDGPLNIQFIIDAFAPKDKKKPPTPFRLDIRNVVIRRSQISFDRRYIPLRSDAGERIDFNHLKIVSLAADVELPVVSRDTVAVDLRRLSFATPQGLDLRHLAFQLKMEPHGLSVKDFELKTTGSRLGLADLQIKYPSISRIKEAFRDGDPLQVRLLDSYVTPSDFKSFLPMLASFSQPLDLRLSASVESSRIALASLLLQDRISGLDIECDDLDFSVPVSGGNAGAALFDAASIRRGRLSLGSLNIRVPREVLSRTRAAMMSLPGNGGKGMLATIPDAVGYVELKASGDVDMQTSAADFDIEADTGVGEVTAGLTISGTPASSKSSAMFGGLCDLTLSLDVDRLMPASLMSASPVDDVTLGANVEMSLDIDRFRRAGAMLRGKSLPLAEKLSSLISVIPSADVALNIDHILFKGESLEGVTLDLTKERGDIDLAIHSSSAPLDMDVEVSGILTADNVSADLSAAVRRLSLPLFSDAPQLQEASLAGNVDLNIAGRDMTDLGGSLALSDVRFDQPEADRHIDLARLSIISGVTYRNAPGVSNISPIRVTTVESDWLTGEIVGDMEPQKIPGMLGDMLYELAPRTLTDFAPGLIAGRRVTASGPAASSGSAAGSLSFDFSIFRNFPWNSLGKLPVTPLYTIKISGRLDGSEHSLRAGVDAPYLQQGRDKLIRDTRLDLSLSAGKGWVGVYSSIPTKKGVLDLEASITARDDAADINLMFNQVKKGAFYGAVSMRALYENSLTHNGYKAVLNFLPSSIFLNGAEWEVDPSTVEYSDKRVSVDGFSIAHGGQHLTVHGIASDNPEDAVVADLSAINLDYIFDTLNINYVTFGGEATGEAVAAGVFSGDPDIRTRGLVVKNLSYNGCVLGDGDMKGDFDIRTKRIGIGAEIREQGRHVGTVDGGIWIGRDSLAFNFDADKLRVGFLQTFMQAFSSKVDGRASGQGTLYGTFHDIDMTGRFYADTISVKVDYTNVVYSGKDSVRLEPGRVIIPEFTVHDSYGNSGKLSGELRHRYFHAPSFAFQIKDVDKMLVYNTNAQMNPVWYGRIFGSGNGMILGTPDKVEIIADMTTERNSDFTFVLDDSMEAAEYSFLTFTDKRKEMLDAMVSEQLGEEDEIVKAFHKKVEQDLINESSEFAMDIRATVTPDIRLTMVMDPASGDRIVARGSGPMNITYSSRSDEMKMFGKYTLEEGKYNFTLQDIILKDFIIKSGSSVSFNGDPMAATLDIRAAYRVNTNLTDLDKSFATDRDLNRSNVPVDAMLLVKGDMTSPDISFDIELPTLNPEITQKVRSIISSEDGMSRQIIYLLALNRFYTPEYTGNSGSGGEWASVASSTLSSQLQNVLGQLTDKFTLAPSLRSDKGDFSDLEVDVAMSSRLFNNRLLINGNFGYRDRATSSTTFVGDFDVEYLLTPGGNLRLKAYNHFNDQNYYLKSALTTQGVGIIFRRDFDDLLRSKKKSLPADSVKARPKSAK